MLNEKMDAPLTTWYCDFCGQPVIKENGYVIWNSDEAKLYYDFKIIHHEICDNKSLPNSQPLSFFLGNDGLLNLLGFFSCGSLENDSNIIKNMHEYIDFICRVQVPYYEQARRYFKTEIGQTVLRNGMLTEAELKNIIVCNLDLKGN